MQILQPRYNKLLRRLLAIQGPNPSPELLEQILPILVLESDRLEYHALADSQLVMSSQIIAGAAGTFPRIGIVNPVGSAKVFVCLASTVSISVVSNVVELREDATVPVATPVALNAADSRSLGWGSAAGPGPITIAADANASAASGSGPVWRSSQGVASDSKPGPSFVLGPGHDVLYVNNVTGVATLIASFFGYIRSLDLSEVSP